jgi:hypothetical protein
MAGLRSSVMPKQDRWAQKDVLADFNKREYRVLEVRVGMTLKHTGSGFTGTVAEFTQGGAVVLTNDDGEQQSFPAHDGAFMHNGSRVAMREPVVKRSELRFTASGSIDVGEKRARVARSSRIWVEGVHDAELIERIWGDDLREAAVAVEPLHGADDLATAVTAFGPGPRRRLGILLDHLVEGSKESRIAASIRDGDVLICGHPYVDIWSAIKPGTIGITAWPDVPMGEPWKEGVTARLGIEASSGAFWVQVLESVTSYRDVETPLVNAVEQLIDFVTLEE